MKFRQAYKILGKAYISDFITDWNKHIGVVTIHDARNPRLKKALSVFRRHSKRKKKRNKFIHDIPVKYTREYTDWVETKVDL